MNVTQQIRIEYADDDLQSRIKSFLKSRHFPAFSTLEVVVENGSVTVTGEVCSYYEKQVALHSCQRVAGVLALIDAVAVRPPRRNIAPASDSSVVSDSTVVSVADPARA